ncbi:sensor histidine kinase [Salinimonas lutimaris]|uniref:HAMP domain-containing histidine kinase n=1 Tax=Salinimonas lutimaris TaxID=914153 RepID=UPI0010C04D74|nr:HAMP domain-containing histidine kinase [Salinimonas lutimaris]
MLLLLFTYLLRQRPLNHGLACLLLLLEITLLNTVIALNGAATNPFSMVLLVPLVIGLMLLPVTWALAVVIASIAGQLTQLYLPRLHAHNMEMAAHAHSMIIGFVLTSVLIAAVVAYFRLQLSRQNAALHTLRERQLRDEQLLAIGTAAAQLTHDAASPVQTIRLLLEEAQETSEAAVLPELEEQFHRLEHMLIQWRDVADDVREARTTRFTPKEVVRSLRHIMALARPEALIQWPAQHQQQGSCIMADRTLLPALTRILLNACEAGSKTADPQVQVTLICGADSWQLTFINAADPAHASTLMHLGSRLVDSESGSGAGAILSNATIEKFGGQVHWYYANGFVTTHIQLPVAA